MSRRVTFRTGLVGAMGLSVVVYAALLVLHGAGLSQDVVNVLGLLAAWLSAGVCALAVSRVRFQQWEVPLAAAAATSYAVGLTYYAAVLAGGGSVTFPSPTDLINLLFYPLMLGALAATVHRHVRGVASSVWLDCALGSLGAAAVLAVVLRPVLDSATAGPRTLATAVAIAPPLFDLVLVAAVAGIAALPGVAMGSRWGLLVAGLLAFAAADVAYALEVNSGAWSPADPLSAGWAIGLALVAMWVDGAAQRDRTATRPDTDAASDATALAVSSAATVAGLGVLIMSSRVSLSTLAVALAAVTLLAAGARSQLAFRLLARMANLRRLAAATRETELRHQAFHDQQMKVLLTDVIASIPHVVYWKDLEGRYRGVNHAYLTERRLTDESEVLGRTDAEVFGEDDFQCKITELETAVLADGFAVLDQHVVIRSEASKDVAARTLLLSVLPQRGADGTASGLIGVGADVSRLVELERQIGQSNRLEAIGQLAAGIAHEINTPVQFVSDNVRFLAESFGAILAVVEAIGPVINGGPATDDTPGLAALRVAFAAMDMEFMVAEVPTAISESQEGLARVGQIVRAMKDFSHPGVGRLDTDVNRAVQSTVQVSRNEWKYVAEVVLDLDADLGTAPCFEGELKQVILNIIVNAAHSIAEQRTRTGQGTLGTITVSTRREAAHVTIAITDDGAGMSQEVRHKVFDPFFTTKEVGKGTGQGLSMVHNIIVERHGGRINVQSTPGNGATFTLILPTQVSAGSAATPIQHEEVLL
ncbi:MAG TPA: ATP-binding protein [Dermatophilaceae bacterium]